MWQIYKGVISESLHQENYKFFFEVFWDFWNSKKAWKDRKS
jgi:hypothetical protein